MVVIRGAAMIAGSNLILFAARGKRQPTVFAINTVASKLTEIVRHKSKSLPFIIYTRIKFTVPNARPHKKATRSSSHKTVKVFLKRISPRAIPRITRAEDWQPELPPVSISMGIKAIRTGRTVNASS